MNLFIEAPLIWVGKYLFADIVSQFAIFGDLNCRFPVTNTKKGLVKDVLRCIRMRQFAVFAAQFADYVVTLQSGKTIFPVSLSAL